MVDDPSFVLFGFAEQPHFRDVAQKLHTSTGRPPTLVSRLDPTMSPAGDADVIDTGLLSREATVHRAFSTAASHLDAETLRQFDECRVLFNRTLDRVFLKPRPHRSHEAYFNVLLSQWLGFFGSRQRAAAVFSSAPHFPWDIVAYFAARHCNVPTLTVHFTLLDDRVLLARDFRASPDRFVSFDANAAFVAPTRTDQDVENRLTLLSSSARQFNEQALDQTTWRAIVPWLMHRTKDFVRAPLVRRVRTEPPENPPPRGAADYFQLSYRARYAYDVRQVLRRKRLTDWLEANSSSRLPNQPFVYFALHSQPERTTDPEAGYFTDMSLALRLLSSALPDDWKVCVKEHPRQVRVVPPDLRQLHYRDVHFYERLAGIEKVVLLRPDLDPDAVMGGCTLTASATGSTIWEGLILGKPGMSFGPTWHDACASSPMVRSRADIEQAVSRLSVKSSDDVLADVRRFAEAIAPSLIVSAGSESQAEQSEVPRDRLAGNLADAIRAAVTG